MLKRGYFPSLHWKIKRAGIKFDIGNNRQSFFPFLLFNGHVNLHFIPSSLQFLRRQFCIVETCVFFPINTIKKNHLVS